MFWNIIVAEFCVIFKWRWQKKNHRFYQLELKLLDLSNPSIVLTSSKIHYLLFIIVLILFIIQMSILKWHLLLATCFPSISPPPTTIGKPSVWAIDQSIDQTIRIANQQNWMIVIRIERFFWSFIDEPLLLHHWYCHRLFYCSLIDCHLQCLRHPHKNYLMHQHKRMKPPPKWVPSLSK